MGGHGGLSHAGKVKSKTPKVEKQEKNKKLTGRAAMRAKYNRKIVNGKKDSNGNIITSHPNRQSNKK
jgi:small subunit ribosomal protein S30e